MKKKKQSLGKRIGMYKESRLGIPVLIFIVALCGTVFFFQGNTATEQDFVGSLLSTGIFCTLPSLVIGAIIWFLVEKLLPRKTLILYHGGLQFLSRKGRESYPWKAIPDVTWTIVKSESTREVIQHSYVFRRTKDNKTISFMSSSYPGLDRSPFNKLLKQAHVKGILNVETKIEWQREGDSSMGLGE